MFGTVHEIINVIWLTPGAVWVLTAFRLKPSVQTVDFGSRSLQAIHANSKLLTTRPRPYRNR
jgi:hypothetical protein